jgi:SARP family transcriptional regulator, regulator of embCAB operon
VSKLRSLLTDHGLDDGSALTGAFGCYRLELPDGIWVDVAVAAEAADEAETALAAGDLDGARRAAALAVSLLRQPFLPGEDGAWVEEKRRGFADAHDRALGVLAEVSLRFGDAAEAVKWTTQSIARAPFRETGYRRLMQAHVAAGNRAEALRVYEQCRQLLADELGTYPSPETESIYRELLEAPLARPVPTPSEPSGDGAQRRVPAGLGRKRLTVALACGVVAGGVAVAAAFVVGGSSGDPPSVLSLAPADGPEDGGSVVEIIGRRFTDATDVHFGRTRASFSVTSDSSITAVSPHRGPGTVDVTVTSGGSTSTTGARDRFTYTRLRR